MLICAARSLHHHRSIGRHILLHRHLCGCIDQDSFCKFYLCQTVGLKGRIESDKNANSSGKNQLLAAEIYPTSGFFKKMNSGIATVADMLATDAGTILALFSGANQSQFISVLESTGNSYLGCIGRY